jgi:ferric-dicitrate binding protein FerR (iron transport regulator)
MSSFDTFEIARLIAARIAGIITEAENERLEAWLAADRDNRRFFDTLAAGDNIACRMEEYTRLDLASVKSRTLEAIAAKSGHSHSCNHNRTPDSKRRRRLLRAVVSAATAAAAVVVAVLLLRDGGAGLPSDAYVKATYLETADGRRFYLGTQGDRAVIKSDAGTVRMGDGALEYVAEDTTANELHYDRIVTPRGVTCCITLPDGSRVWMNAATELRYTASARRQTREVDLTGEAYFEVTPSDRPFVVNTAGAVVRVLGTSFNVSAYPDEPRISTTLVEGVVEVCSQRTEQTVLLAPGRQANVGRGGEIVVREVDPLSFTGWTDDVFIFDNEDMASIMRKLSRWYDVDITFEDEALTHAIFYGVMPRHESVTTILDMIKKTYPMEYHRTRNGIKIVRLKN